MLGSSRVNWLAKLKEYLGGKPEPEHLRRGKLGERAARRYLKDQGLKFLTANYRSERGEIDLVFRDRSPMGGRSMVHANEGDCLVFVEVKTRSSEAWTRPASAVNAAKRRRISRTALDYLRELDEPRVKVRFDIVEVLLAAGEVREVRHLPCAFQLSAPYRHG